MDEEVPLAIAAHRLHVTWATAYRLLLSGELTGRRRGSHWFVLLRDVEHRIGEGAPPRSRASTDRRKQP